MSLSIVWNGEISGNSSFGIAGIEQCLAFEEWGCDVYIQPIVVKQGLEPIPDRIHHMIKKANHGWPYWNSVFMHQGFPHYFGVCGRQYTKIKTAIGVNDSDTVMGADEINKNCTLVFGASDWVTQAYTNAGVTVPRHTFPYGINPEIWQYRDRPAVRDKFRFLCVGDHTGRKRFEELCYNFREEFKPEEPVELEIKCWGTQENAENLRKAFQSDQINIIYDNSTILDLREHYYAADCFVIPTSGDAVCMPILEAMGTGLPVLTTGWGGQTQWTLPEFSYLIDYTLYPSPYLAGNQAMPDWRHFKKLLRQIYESPAEVREKGKAASEFMHSNYTWRMGVDKAVKILKKYL